MVLSSFLSDPTLNTYDTATTTAVTAVPVAGVVTVEDRFATMPALKAVSAPISTTYRPFEEEELHTSFEQAISERVLAVKKMLNLDGDTLVISTPLMPLTTSTATIKPGAKKGQPRRKTLKLLHTSPWLRGLTYGSFVLLLMLMGFDLMGMLVLFAR